MELHYYRGDRVGPNFGDELNPWMWSRLIPELLGRDDGVVLLGIGTIISEWIPDEPRKVVLGAGTSPELSPRIDGRWDFRAVRGPLTAARLGLPAALAYTDAAVLVRTLWPAASTPRDGVCLMLHHARSRRAPWGLYCKMMGMRYVDPHEPVDDILAALAGARLVLTEALHGAVVADAFRVPWVPLQVHDNVREFKWDDWCRSLGLAYEPVRVSSPLDARRTVSSRVRAKVRPPAIAWELSRLAGRSQGFLSDDRLVDELTERFLGEIRRTKARYGVSA